MGLLVFAIKAALTTSLVAAVMVAFLVALVRLANMRRASAYKAANFNGKQRRVIAFFHPFCDSGGGGEKVLFQGLKALLDDSMFEDDFICVYSGSELAPEAILKKVQERFNIEVPLNPNRLAFVKLEGHQSMSGANYPSLTLLWQMLAYNAVAGEALSKVPCDVFIDTIGVGFAYPLVKILFGPRIVSYTHYPTISTDMLKQTEAAQFNNKIGSNPLKIHIKKLYYRVLMALYSACGRFADQIGTNSSWTNAHIQQLWRAPERTKLIFPPTDAVELKQAIRMDASRPNAVMSFAQFRPEKAHMLQLEVWKEAKPRLPEDAVFYVVGSTRDEEDRKLLAELKQRALVLDVQDSVVFRVNEPYEAIMDLYRTAKVGLHTMKEEHFGITIVQMMAAGLVVVAHKSGGPLKDIIGATEEPVGYLADSAEEYATQLVRAVKWYDSDAYVQLRKNARQHVADSFSAQTFDTEFTEMVKRALVSPSH